MRIHSAATTVSSWTGEFRYTPSVFVQPESVEDIVQVVKDRETFPSPVRAVGSNHSTVPVGDPDGGTLVDMRGMNRILNIDEHSVRVEAGALYIDVAKELERRNLQLPQNPIIGNLTVGAAASTGTKDAALPDEFGQLSSYAHAMTLVDASGKVIEVNEDDDPELMQVLRSSYGALGIIVDVTFRVKPLQLIEVTHREVPFSELRTAIPALLEEDASQLLFIYPFIDSMTVET
ncbi:MAG: FAD-binding protein, partial [Chloroflexota bacterium]